MSSSVASWHQTGPSTGAVRRAAVALVVLALVLVGLPFSAGSALAASNQRIELRVLVVSSGQPSEEAIATQLDREGVPYTKVLIGDAGRPTIDAGFLADAATRTARFQAVVLPNHEGGGLAAEEVAALTDFERTYGIRQVSAYNWANPAIGLAYPTYSGPLDAGSVAITDAGLAGPFGYLDGALPIDDFAPGLEVYGYLGQPLSPQPEGQSFTPLMTATAGGTTGVLAGVLAQGDREELVLTAAYNPSMQWWNQIAPGVVSWMTRGIHLGEQRNYFAVHIDDVFLPDSRWSVDGNCTPGDDCADPATTTEDIRMVASDVDRLLAWQDANDFKLDMVYNAAGIEEYRAQTGQDDPMAAALVANEAEFPWINHTWSHPYLGCIQIAPSIQGEPWRCATSEADLTSPNRQDPEVVAEESGGIYWASTAFLTQQIQQNIDWAVRTGLTDFDPTELVTGEHSGLVTTNQPTDNPFLGPVLAGVGVDYTASDASRELNPRAVGANAVTVPRYPMNIYYNTGTYRDQIDEYNWYYTSAANGGGGICENNPASTCITPLPAATDAEAQASFEGYLKPLEVRNALSKVITNDPRPFYAHQSNLAEDALLYPVVAGVLDEYRGTYADNAPVVRTDMASQYRQLARMATWRAASSETTAYLDSTGVHIPGAGIDVPLTVPSGTTVTGASLESYGGELSGWTTGSVTAVPPSPMGGYGGTPAAAAPGAPAAPGATPGDASATVTWAAPTDTGGSEITGFEIEVFAGDDGTATRTVLLDGGGTTSTEVDGLTNGTAYTFTVAAVNAVGTGAVSGRSTPVTPMPAALGAPTLGDVTPGDGSATVAWAAPAGATGVTGYQVRVFEGGAAEPLRTETAAADAAVLEITGLANGTAYTIDVAATNLAGPGAPSERSEPVTPRTTPGAPTIGTVTTGDAAAAVTWTAPADTGGSPVTGYVVSVFEGEGTEPVATVERPADATSADVTDLTNGTTYGLTVTAVNAAGAGTPSGRLTVTPVTPATVPGAPTIGTVTGGNAAASLTWTPPAEDGGSPITGYVVSVYEGDGTEVLQSVERPADATGAEITGLTNGTAYTFTVAAVNGVDRGPESARSADVTPATVPAVPTGVVAVAGDGSATVTWTAPGDDGGSAVTGYVVTVLDGEQELDSAAVTVTGTSASVTGLTNGTAYTFTIAAANAVGAGDPSARSAAVTPARAAVAPGAPTITSATGGDAAASLGWAAPVDDGGSPITGYEVAVYDGEQQVGPAVVTVTGTTASITGLTNGTAYTFTVAAVNAAGTGAPSPRSGTVTPQAVPGAPTGVTGTPGNGSVTVTWVNPDDDGGSPLTGYEVRAYSGASTEPVATVPVGASATSAVVTGLANGTAYTFTVAAVNGAGTGAESAPSASVVPVAPATVPGAPTGTSATAGDGSAAVSWTAPASDGGSPINGYLIRGYPAGSGTATVTTTADGAASSIIVPGLTNGTAYTFTVAAVNAAGTGAESARSSAVTPAPRVTVPGAPVLGSVTPGNRSATVSWTAPADGGSRITGYEVSVYRGAETQVWRTVRLGSSSTGTTVSGLTNGTAYTFAVTARNAVGAGPQSVRSAEVVPGTVPGEPRLQRVTAGDASASLTWRAPSNTGGSAITGYVVSLYEAGSSQVSRTVPVAGGSTAATVTGLTNGTSYRFAVAATNAVGTGPQSDRSSRVTPAALPGAPVLTGLSGGNRSATVSWAAPAETGGSRLSGYVVSVYRSGETRPVRTVRVGANATRTTVRGLANGTSYGVTVAARNGVGVGPASEMSSPVTPQRGGVQIVVPQPGGVENDVSQPENVPAGSGWSQSAIQAYQVAVEALRRFLGLFATWAG